MSSTDSADDVCVCMRERERGGRGYPGSRTDFPSGQFFVHGLYLGGPGHFRVVWDGSRLWGVWAEGVWGE